MAPVLYNGRKIIGRGIKMPIYKRNYIKTIKGWAIVEAKEKENAKELFNMGHTDDECDMNSEYYWEEEITKE